MQSNSSKCARRYDREFKEQAVALIQSGRSITEVSRDLGVSHWSLSRWLKEAQSGQALSEPKTLSSETPEQRELRRLRGSVCRPGGRRIAREWQCCANRRALIASCLPTL